MSVFRLGLAFGLFLGAGGSRLAAQEPAPSAPDIAAPFSLTPVVGQVENESGAQWENVLGRRAVEAGLFSLAEGYFRQALVRPAIEDGLREAMMLELTTALIAQGKTAEAAGLLDGYPGPRDETWNLRRGALAFAQNDIGGVEAALAGIDPTAVPLGDIGTYHFLRAVVLDEAGEAEKADAEFEQSFALSPSAQRALFRLEQYQRRLTRVEISDGSAARLKAQADQHPGGRVAFQFTLLYAAVLDKLARKAEAIEVLKRQSRILPAAEADLRDQTLLLLGLVAGAKTPDGRNAFEELVASGSDRDWQRVALVRLVEQVEPEGGAVGLRMLRMLGGLLATEPPHPLTEDLLFFRAAVYLRSWSLAQAENDPLRDNLMQPNWAFEEAEKDANALFPERTCASTRSPSSPARRGSAGVTARRPIGSGRCAPTSRQAGSGPGWPSCSGSAIFGRVDFPPEQPRISAMPPRHTGLRWRKRSRSEAWPRRGCRRECCFTSGSCR